LLIFHHVAKKSAMLIELHFFISKNWF